MTLRNNLNKIEINTDRTPYGKAQIKYAAIKETFGISISTLKNWKKGKMGIEKQRLYYVLWCMNLDTMQKIKELQLEK